jgi:hypothetical protein
MRYCLYEILPVKILITLVGNHGHHELPEQVGGEVR